MDISKQILKFAIEVVELKGSIRFMDIVRYVWEPFLNAHIDA